jgi:hypothetical protein
MESVFFPLPSSANKSKPDNSRYAVGIMIVETVRKECVYADAKVVISVVYRQGVCTPVRGPECTPNMSESVKPKGASMDIKADLLKKGASLCTMQNTLYGVSVV